MVSCLTIALPGGDYYSKSMAPEYVHVKGVDNVVADALRRVDTDFDPAEPNDGDAQVCAHS